MFIGSWLINLAFGIFAFLIVFIGSIYTNTALTSLIRALAAFIIFYLIAFVFRMLWQFAFKEVTSETNKKANTEKQETTMEPAKQSNSKEKLSEEEIKKTSQYVKELINE